MPPPSSFDPRQRLDQWQVDPPPDVELADQVLRRIRESELDELDKPSLLSWLIGLMQRPAYTGGFAAVFLIVGGVIALMAVYVLRSTGSGVAPVEYRLVIDPVYRLAQAEENIGDRASESHEIMSASLHWLKKELQLNEEQFTKLASLHGSYEATLTGQFAGLRASEAMMQDFDQLRFQSELIDFIEVYHAQENFRRQREQATETTADLVRQVSQIVTSEQRGRYLQLLQDLPPTGGTQQRGKSPAI